MVIGGGVNVAVLKKVTTQVRLGGGSPRLTEEGGVRRHEGMDAESIRAGADGLRHGKLARPVKKKRLRGFAASWSAVV